jgi:uncharacterized repeat protein (TIGR03803 family)
MHGKRFSLGLGTILAVFTVALFVTTSLAATEKVLHRFGSGKDGASPYASLIWDAAGNLYGTTYVGGDGPCYSQGRGCGTVFELSPKEGGGWTEKVLHNFGHGIDGANPYSNLIWDSAGNLYGTTYWGGTHGYGTAFELTPRGDGEWTEQVLHNFGINGTDGTHPYSGLIWDAAGNLYGTAYYGGANRSCDNSGYVGCGTVFELTPKEDGGWTAKTLHNFGDGKDGYWPAGGLVFDAAGNLYGTATSGGVNSSCDYGGCGTVFEMTPKEGGGWTEKTLHNFRSGMDGSSSNAGLIFDAAGNLYGTTYVGGDGGEGTVFEMTPQEGGGWTEKVLHNFGRDPGIVPSAGLILDAAGNLYGTTDYGSEYGAGIVFELTPEEGGGWTGKTLHNFGSGMDGVAPMSGLIFDAAGNLYGTTAYGGPNWGGTVFEITPD